jgi:hypothetical protein
MLLLLSSLLSSLFYIFIKNGNNDQATLCPIIFIHCHCCQPLLFGSSCKSKVLYDVVVIDWQNWTCGNDIMNHGHDTFPAVVPVNKTVMMCSYSCCFLLSLIVRLWHHEKDPNPSSHHHRCHFGYRSCCDHVHPGAILHRCRATTNATSRQTNVKAQGSQK